MEILKYTSWVTGKKVQVEISMSESGVDYNIDPEGILTESEHLLVEQEAIRAAKTASNSKILLG